MLEKKLSQIASTDLESLFTNNNVDAFFQMASSLEKLETQLEMFTENVRQLGIIVSDFQPQGQNVFNQKM